MSKIKSAREQRLEFLLNNAIGYIAELKERESKEERQDFFESIIGLNKEEMEYYEV